LERYGIVAAWEPELKLLMEKYPPIHQEKVAGWTFHIHEMFGLEVVSVVSGVGKVKAASCTQLLIDRYNIKELYMTGICGGLSSELMGLDIVVATATLQHGFVAISYGLKSKS
jgi:adenosylhomocysteine nucleosidase